MTRLITFLLTIFVTFLAGTASTVHAIPAKNTVFNSPPIHKALQQNLETLTGSAKMQQESLTQTSVDAAEKTPAKVVQVEAKEVYGQQAIYFEPNLGQTDAAVKYTARGPGYTLFLTGTEAVFSLAAPRQAEDSKKPADLNALPEPMARQEKAQDIAPPEVLRMQLLGKTFNPKANIKGLKKQQGISNYYYGNDKDDWQTNVPHFSKVEYEDVYPGIDLVYYGNPQQLEYDFVVAPGADPDQIQLAFAGADKIDVADNGNLNLTINDREVAFRAPVIYQMKNGKREPVAGNYSIQPNKINTVSKTNSATQVGFQLAAYDTNLPLIIDPVLVYSTYLGGTEYDSAKLSAFDADGGVLVTGVTNSTDFPMKNAVQNTINGYYPDTHVSRFDSNGQLIFSTYLGGQWDDYVQDITVDNNGDAYLVGTTFSSDYPVTPDAIQPDNANGGGRDLFITRLNSIGQLVYSTYLGGYWDDFGSNIAVDMNGIISVYGTTESDDMPVTADALQVDYGGSIYDSFLTRLDSNGQLHYSTYLGGEESEYARNMAISANGDIALIGNTSSHDYPTLNAIQGSPTLYSADFVTVFDRNNQLKFSTFLGDDSDSIKSVEFTGNGDLLVAGETTSTNLPLANEYQGILAGLHDAFITRFNRSGQLVFSTYLGGDENDGVKSVSVAANGDVLVTGITTSANFPVENAIQENLAGPNDAFISRFNSSGQLLFSTFHGGENEDSGEVVSVAANGDVFVTGNTNSISFPVENAIQGSSGGQSDAFITQLDSTGQMLFSTYLGGEENDSVSDMAVDLYGDILVTGATVSVSFPVLNAFQSNNAGSYDIFVSKISLGELGWDIVGNYSEALESFDSDWSYHWNENGPIGNSANYSDLLWNGYWYNSNGLPVKTTDDELNYGLLSTSRGHPGMGVEQGVAADRYVIASFDVSAAGDYRINNSSLQQTACIFGNGLDLRVYVNDSLSLQRTVPSGGSVVNFDYLLGSLKSGDRINIAIGPDGRDGCDGFQLDYDIERKTNSSPVLDNPGDQSSLINVPVNLVLSATDPDSDPLSYSLSGAPTGLDIDSQTGVISGTPTQPGDYNVTASVSDGVNTSSITFMWQITETTDWQSIAGYQTDYQPVSPALGWRYLWNSKDAIGNAAGYQSLLWADYRYDSDGLPGNSSSDELSAGFLSADRGHPGEGTWQGAAADRYVIAGYSINTAAEYRISNSEINQLSCAYSNGLDLRIYVNDSLYSQYGVPGDGTIVNFDTALGNLSPGDEVFIAVGPRITDGCDGFSWDFSIDRM